MALKERHRHLDSRAAKPGSTKVEDVKRHVFKVCSLITSSSISVPYITAVAVSTSNPDDRVTNRTGRGRKLTKSPLSQSIRFV